MTASKGLFVVFEGGEGSGKSTQAELLALRLGAGGWPILHLREPGGTPLGEELRELLLHRRSEIGAEAELLMFLAARAELVRSVIRPQLDRGGIVICDRFAGSTFAYQGNGRGLDLDSLKQMNAWATGGLEPDLVVLLDVPVEEGIRRAGKTDAFENEDASFHERVREGYLALAAADPERWRIFDATLDRMQLAQDIGDAVEGLFTGGSSTTS